MTKDSTGSDYPQFVWNHAVHEDRHEVLYFWRLGFYPSFVSREVVPAIDEVVKQCGIRSSVLYELFGIHDLLLRVWIPASCPLEKFRKMLLERLGRLSLKTCDPFIVKSPIRHWLFPDGQPSPDELSTLTVEQVAQVQSGKIADTDFTTLRDRKLVASFEEMDRRDGADPEHPDWPLIKFAIVVVGEPRLGVGQLEQFERTIASVLDAARGPRHRSLYSGFGFGHFLILGSVPAESFYSIDEQLIGPLNAAHIQEVYESRTYTHVSGVKRFLRFTESLSRTVEPPAPKPAEDAEPPHVPNPRRFQELRKLGEGGFAPVYHVFDTFEEVERALKVFPPEHVAAAKREVQMLRKFDDPRIVKVISTEEEPGGDRWLVVMEYVDGVPLSEYIEENHPIDDRYAIAIVDGILGALTVIHPDQEEIDHFRKQEEISPTQYEKHLELMEKGIVHRDIKPENIMLLDNGSIKLIDFNIASPVGAAVKTRSGTPPFQPPDASGHWDVSTDLFATGVVLYELLCGVHPYPGGEPRADRGPIDPREPRRDLPAPLAEFLLKSCSPYREERFKTAREMRAALALAAQSLP